MPGCSSVQSSGIDPTGEHLFATPPPPTAAAVPVVAPVSPYPPNERYFDDPLGPLPWDDVAVLIEPHELVAPVGSEVVVIAGVLGPDGYLRTNRRLEWSITPGSVGQFVSIEPGGFTDLLLGDFTWPHIVNATTAIGDTSRSNVLLNRGAPTRENDKYVRRGEGWISLTSPLEGTSYVNVVAPEIHNWDARRKTAVVHWVDAVAQYPPPAINPAGTKHVFTTTVAHSSNQSPCENWIVRYEIIDGPPAGFLPSGAASAEVRTNPAGQASVEIIEKVPASGVNKIAIQVIRPADVPGSGGQRLVVFRNGTTTKTWSAPDLAVHVQGPPTAGIGATLTYQIDVSNPGDLPAKDVTALVDVPDGLTYVGGNPAAEVAGRQLHWRLGDLGARQRRPIEAGFRAEKQGSAVLCCDATAAGGLKARDCATTTIALAAPPPPAAPLAAPGTPGAPLEVSITPAQTTATVGGTVKFKVVLHNRTTTPMTKIGLRVFLDPGLEHRNANQKGVIERVLPSLSPGQTWQVGVEVRVSRSGRLTAIVEATVAGAAPVSAKATVTAIGEAGPSAPAAGAVPLSVTMTGPPKSPMVGDTVRFTTYVRNTGSVTLQNLQVVDRCDSPLVAVRATDGRKLVNDSLVWNIDSLLPNQAARFEVECTCQAASAKVYNRVAVTLPDGGRAASEVATEILPLPSPKRGTESDGIPDVLKKEKPVVPPLPPQTIPKLPDKPAGQGLALSAVPLANPVHPDGQFAYEIRLTSKETVPYHQVVVTATVPEGMVPVVLGSGKVEIKGQVMQFEPVAELPPGQTLTWLARVFTKQTGSYRLHVEMVTPDLPKPMAVDSIETEVRN
jgi:uncharacterized repeat protein (TIGR01451 family)